MATPVLRNLPFFRRHLHHQLQRHVVGSSLSPHRPWSTLTEPVHSDNDSDQNIDVPSLKEGANRTKWADDPDDREWKSIEAVIVNDIESRTSLVKELLHSRRYKDGERLTVEDEKAVVEGFLAYHPHSEDKIGCGLESIIVDRHPQFLSSRCLFVARTDGGLADFSYRKCIQAYIQERYPSHGERFCKVHFNRKSFHL